MSEKNAKKMRSTIVEAALWHRFRDAFRTGDVRRVLPEVRMVMGVEARPSIEGPALAGGTQG